MVRQWRQPVVQPNGRSIYFKNLVKICMASISILMLVSSLPIGLYSVSDLEIATVFMGLATCAMMPSITKQTMASIT